MKKAILKKYNLSSILLVYLFITNINCNRATLVTTYINDSSPTPSYCEISNRMTNSPFANSGESGIDGTSASTAFAICTGTQLNAIGADLANYRDKFYKLEMDIDLSSFNETNWNTIGEFTNEFTGQFNGQGYSISNFTYTDATKSFFGLFGYIDGGTISDLNLRSFTITGNSEIGMLIGRMQNGSTVERVSATGSVLSTGASKNEVGGLVGIMNDSTDQITDCYVEVTLNAAGAGNSHGGVVGRVNDGTISNCYIKGTITGQHAVGGLVGQHFAGTTQNSFSTATVTGDTSSFDAVSLSIGLGGTVTNVYFDNTKVCTNLDVGGSCNSPGGATGIDTSVQTDYFYLNSNPPLNSWNFITIWKTVSNDFPIFR